MNFTDLLTPTERDLFLSLDTPYKIQTYLDSIPYVGEDLNRSPLRVIRDQQCHCLDGGLFAAVALRRIGHVPMIIDLVPVPHIDDDHVLAIYKHNGNYGVVAKSNFVNLRFREPVYRSLRELVMSYFDWFYNVDGHKTLRGYTRPINLTAYDRYNWMGSEQGVEVVVKRLYSMQPISVIDQTSINFLSPMDKRSYDAGMLGVNYDGLYKPGKDH